MYLEGVFESNARGFGFVSVDGMEKDLFIPPDRTGGAFYHDTVQVRLLPGYDKNAAPIGKGERRQEAEVTRIIERGTKTLVGTFTRDRKAGYVTPDNGKIHADIFVNRFDSMGAVTGHKVVVTITDYGSPNKPPQGKITEILGHMDDPGVDILSIIRAYDLPGEFPDEVKEEVRHIPDHVDVEADKETAAKGREDWRKIPTVTIDGPDTKDIDDAVSIEKTPNGYRLGVHIADVAQYVKEGSPLDKEALNRATSIYLVDRVIPMLPHELSNGICSLNQGEDRYALSCIMEFDENGNETDSRVVETIIRSDAKLSYPGVMKLFNEKDDSEIVHALEMQGYKATKTRALTLCRMLRRGLKLAKILEKKRRERGSIDFDFQESEIILDENGRPVDIRLHESNDATRMIENFMIAANETVARTFCELKIPFVYRTHGQPLEEKISGLKTFIGNYGYKLEGGNSDVTPKAICSLLNSLKGKPEETMITTMTLRSMQRAEYTTECGGHYGLALKYYCHFTSPIRRYPDTQIHRIIKEYLHGQLDEKRIEHYNGILPYVCRQSSTMERRADEAERETDKQKKAEYMKERLGEVYEGKVSGLTGWGMYVELPNTVEGMVPVADMRDDYYDFDEQNYILKGEHTGNTYELGQTVKVRCASCDIIARTIDFAIDGQENLPPKGRQNQGGGHRDHGRNDHSHADSGRSKKDRGNGSTFFPMRNGSHSGGGKQNSYSGRGKHHGRGKH